MANIPHIQEPDSPTVQTHSLTTPKSSRFRSFFSWRKTSHSPLRPSTRAGDEHSPRGTTTEKSNLRPSLSPRSRSANPDLITSSSQHISDRHQSHKQDRISTDPPPLAQVQGQAILHASLETPVSFFEKSRSTQTHLHVRDTPTQEVEDSIEVKRAHKRTETEESSCSTKTKHFFLINGPYLLQYDANSEGDALPEKIMALNRDTVAFACDAVPGRPWVLQVSRSSSSMAKSQGQTLRPSWSRLTLRQTEQKRMVNVMLLIFDDSEELYGWLYAVRKEIEHLGGIEYRPDTENDDQSWRDDLARKFASTSSSDAASPSSSVGRTIAPNPPVKTDVGPIRNTLSRLSRRNTSASVASSKKSLTSLDRLRDSVTSDGYSSTLATSSCEPSVSSTSPICDQFPNINSVTDRPAGGLSLRSDSFTGVSQSKSPSRGRSLLERRKLSVHSLQIAQDVQRARSVLPDLPSAITGSPNSACSLVQASNHIPDPEPEKRTSTDREDAHKAFQDQTEVKPAIEAARKHSKSDSTSGAVKPKYSLFPAKPSPESKADSHSPPVLAVPSIAVANPTSINKKNEVPDLRPEPKHRKSRSRTVTLELRQHRVSALLGAGEFDMPQRSPAVTDDMIMSNFGVMRDQPPLSPMPEVKVPGLVDLKIDLDFLKGPYQQQSRKRSVLENKRASSTRSVSSVYSDASSARSKAPVGPPPSGPLPAVPSDSRRSSRTQRSSQHSHYSTTRHSGASTPIKTSVPSSSKINVVLPSPPSYESATSDQKQRHRRTISSSLDGPPPPARSSSRLSNNDARTRSRSRSRARPAPIKV